MKKIGFFASLLFLSLLLGSCSSEPMPSSGNPDFGSYQLTDIPGSDMKLATKLDSIGKIVEEGTLKNGEKHGEWLVYSPDRDVPRSVANYENGKLNGPYMEFNTFGQVELICGYLDHKLHGRFVRLKNIRPLEKGNYVHGELDGEYTKFYQGKDQAQQIQLFKNGKLDGTTKFFDEAGNLIMQYEYKNGEKISGGIVETKPSATEMPIK